jgi:hypothetical protein
VKQFAEKTLANCEHGGEYDQQTLNFFDGIVVALYWVKGVR